MDKDLGVNFDVLIVRALSVGQGTANLIEGYAGGKLIYLALIDCGGDGDSHDNVVKAKALIYDKMKLRADNLAAKNCTHHLDYYILSHFDQDHFDVFDRIINQINATNVKVNGNKKTKVKKRKKYRAAKKNKRMNDVFRDFYKNEVVLEEDILYKYQMVETPSLLRVIMDYFYWELRSYIIVDDVFSEMQDDEELEENLFLHYHQHQRDDWSNPRRSMTLTSMFEDCEINASVSDAWDGTFNIYFRCWSNLYFLESRITGTYETDSLTLTTEDDSGRAISIKYACAYHIINFFIKTLSLIKDYVYTDYKIEEFMIKTIQRIANIDVYEYDTFFESSRKGRATMEEIIREFGTDMLYADPSNANKLKIGYFLHGHVGKKGTKTPSIYETLEGYSDHEECIHEDWLIHTKNNVIKLRVIPPAPVEMNQKVVNVSSLFNKDVIAGASANSGKNQFSLIAVLEDARYNHSIVFSGDATAQSMYWFLTNKSTILNGTGKICTLIAPHHGSEETSKGSYNVTDKTTGIQNSYDILKVFVKHVNAYRIIISAGVYNSHGHPNREFMERCLTQMTARTDEHTVKIFFKDCKTKKKSNKDNYNIYLLKKYIFTTVKSLEPSNPVKLCCYDYVFEQGTTFRFTSTLTREENYGGTVTNWPF